MSLVCHFVAHDRSRAEVVADTLCWDGDGPAAFTTKILIYSHNLCVMGHRGPVPFLWAVHRRLCHAFHGAGLDGMVKAVEPLARMAQAEIEGAWPDHNNANELILVGYSSSKRGFAAVHLASSNDFKPAEQRTGGYFSGVDRDLPHREEPLSPGEWINAASALKDYCGCDGWIGGDLVLHTLTAAGGGAIEARKLYRFPDHAQTLEAIEARWQTT